MQKLNKIAKRRKRSTIVLGTVPPRRAFNADLRPREYLTPKEIDRLIEGARKRGRYGVRDATMILVAYRHGLRASEVCLLTWDQIDFAHGLFHVRRLKSGMPSVQRQQRRRLFRRCTSRGVVDRGQQARSCDGRPL